MKFKTIVVCWVLLMALCLIPVFIPYSRVQRDMVYYSSVADSVASGETPPDGCTVLYMTDPDYSAKLNSFYKSNALIMDIIQDDVITGKIIWDDTAEIILSARAETTQRALIIWGVAALCGSIILVIIYVSYIRPFRKLQKFTGEIAKGNLDLPLSMGRSNYFGTFTESFDIMREELKKAREGQVRAERAKQEMMAELSHDIRTPLATINATCEVLEVKSKDPDVISKVGVIKAKAGTIDSLITNMMNASLAEVEELKVDPREESSLLIRTMIDNLHDIGDIKVIGDLPECLLYYDPLRLEQVIDNVVGNSIKYAGTEITVEYIRQDSGVVIRISDKGPGVPEDELTLVTQKFYRGSDSEGVPGSGLGLYLADYFMKKMEGEINFYNATEGGFTVEIFVRKI